MKALQRAALLGVLAFTWIVGTSYPLLATQQPAAATRQALTPDQMAEFLLNARIISTKDAGKGVTRTRRATLSDGQITHDAQIQTVDISKFTFTPDGGLTELNFRDSYRFNIAGYQLARLLDLDNVPVSVERRVQRDQAAVTWWVDDVLMDEAGRLKAEAQKKVPTEWPSIRTVNQIQLLRVFDELIANNDRNLGNLLWTADGKMWMIDHTRAFRTRITLKAPQVLARCERGLLESMRRLTTDTVQAAVGKSLTKEEIESLLARRNEIVKLFEDKIAQRGEGAILYTLER